MELPIGKMNQDLSEYDDKLLAEDVICAKCGEHAELYESGTYCCGANAAGEF